MLEGGGREARIPGLRLGYSGSGRTIPADTATRRAVATCASPLKCWALVGHENGIGLHTPSTLFYLFQSPALSVLAFYVAKADGIQVRGQM